ncbi:MAG TPA: MarR family transcriptional regulator [Solirubrobacteraceae bacterium]|nr:MarR family transcriptional regulator [Solirubrobacteraceae bacterium]
MSAARSPGEAPSVRGPAAPQASSRSPATGREAAAAPSPAGVAAALRASVGVLVRRLRQVHAAGELTLPESSALARLERHGPATAADLARAELISPQSIAATLATLQQRGLVDRRPDPDDGRRIILAATPAGRRLVSSRRSAKVEALAATLADGFSIEELTVLEQAVPLLQRLAERL